MISKVNCVVERGNENQTRCFSASLSSIAHGAADICAANCVTIDFSPDTILARAAGLSQTNPCVSDHYS
jgi:hypothetical protein